jgi:hypothetical protein
MSASDWLAGATRIEGSGSGAMTGGPPRWVWHTYEAGYSLTAANGARGLISAGNDVHFTFHPISGEVVQILPASAGGKGLLNAAGGVQTNRMGTVCIQVEVIARAARPWTLDLTGAGRRGLALLVGFARAHGIPDVWPAGPPPAYPPGSGNRSPSIWTSRAGHYGHSQVPENDHGDPGALDVRALFAAVPIPAPNPTPAPTPKETPDMVIIRTPSNGDFLQTSLGRAALASADASAAEAGGFPTAHLGAVTTTNIYAAAAAITAAFLGREPDVAALTAALAGPLAAAVAADLPASPAGTLTAADVEAAAETAVRAVLHGA